MEASSQSEISKIIDSLGHSPTFLSELLFAIPDNLLKLKRLANKWTVHEHACHLAQAEQMIFNRFKAFRDLDRPQFQPYIPDKTVSADNLLRLNLNEELSSFRNLRSNLVHLVSTFDQSIWEKKADHHEYIDYSAHILLRHTLMHDHFHMYRIEELWLTKDEYL